MNIAFLISAYTDPQQLGNMVRALADKEHWFFVHVDRKVDITPFLKSVEGQKRVNFTTKRFTSNWGGYGQVRYQMELLRESIECGIAFDRLFLLTAQDYPLVSKQQLTTILRDNPNKEYLIGYNATKYNAQLERTTVYHFFRDVPEWLRLRKVARWLMTKLPIRKPHYLNVDGEHWDLYNSSSYMCITRGLAIYILKKMHECKEIGRYFKTAFVPEELVIPTIVFNSPYRRNATLWPNAEYPGLYGLSTVTFFDYSNKIHIFDESDYELLMGCGKMFARKFSSTKSEKLMQMLHDRNGI